MKHLFFNIPYAFEEAAKIVFHSLGIDNFGEGDSSHVKYGVYYTSSVFGTAIRLEANSYDYDDRYGYMLTVKRDVLSDVNPDDLVIAEIANVVIRILHSTLNTEIAYENKDNALQLYSGLTVKVFGNE